MSRVLKSHLNTATPGCIPAGTAGSRLVLSVERLRRRDQGPNSDRVASILGGATWLVRAWRRIERSAALKQRCRAFIVDARRHETPFRLGLVHARRVDVFHAPSMAFRFQVAARHEQ